MNIFNNIKLINRVNYLIILLSIFILSFSYIYYIIHDKFKITSILVNGANTPIKLVIKHLLLQQLNGNMITQNLELIKNECQKIPHIKDVNIIRKFPNTLIINLIPYQAVANLSHNRFLSNSGEIFQSNHINKNLITISALDNDANIIYHMIESNDFFINHHLIVSDVYFNGSDVIKLNINNGLTVILCENNLNQLKVLDKYWNKLYTINKNLFYINMCYEDAIAIK